MVQTRIELGRPLPAVCLCCEAAATHYSKQTFINTNPWTLWTVPLGTWYFNKVVLSIPLCEAHRNTIRYRWVAPFVSLVLGLLSIFCTWGIYSAVHGREAGDEITGWVGGAAAFIVAIFYAALLYVSFTRPHISKVQGDVITLSRVSTRFSNAVRGQDSPVPIAEVIDEIPIAQIDNFAPSSTLKSRSASTAWSWILLICLGLGAIFVGVVGLGLVVSARMSPQVQIKAERIPSAFLLNGSTQLRMTYSASGTLDDRDQFAWLIHHGEQTLTPRYMSAWQLRQGGTVEFQLFDPRATSAEIWLESRPLDGSPGRRVSNVVRVKTQ